MKLSDFLKDIGRPIVYYPSLARFLGGKNEAVFLSQFIYWTGKEKNEGWIFKNAEEITDETGLSYKEQRSARRKLKRLGILKEHYHRIGHTMYYKIALDALDNLWKKRNATVTPMSRDSHADEKQETPHAQREGGRHAQRAFPDIPKGKVDNNKEYIDDLHRVRIEDTRTQKHRFCVRALSFNSFLKETGDEHTNTDAAKAIMYFLAEYKKLRGQTHPNLRPEKWEKILGSIMSCDIGTCSPKDFHLIDMTHMIDDYFKTSFDCNYMISHFNSEMIKFIRANKVGV